MVLTLDVSQKAYIAGIRTMLCAWVILVILHPTISQKPVDALWTWLQNRPLFHRSFFETVLTVLVYIMYEAYYVSLATKAGPRPPLPRRIDQRAGSRHLWRNGTVRVRKLRGRLYELLLYVGPLLFLDLILIKKFKGVKWEDMVQSGGYDVTALKSNASIGMTNPLNNASSFAFGKPSNIEAQHFLLPSLHNFTWTNPVQLSRALPKDPPSALRLSAELMASLALYDFIFFIIHLALHAVPALFRRIHATHHDHAEIHAQVTNQLDLAERLLLILTANFSLQIIGAHVLTRTLFVPVFVLFLVQNHCGLDTLSYDKIFPRGWAAGPSVHAQHHRLGNVGFAPYFTWCDTLYERLTRSKTTLDIRRTNDQKRVDALLEKRSVNRTTEVIGTPSVT